jgi:hypothetical protein
MVESICPPEYTCIINYTGHLKCYNPFKSNLTLLGGVIFNIVEAAAWSVPTMQLGSENIMQVLLKKEVYNQY